MDPEHAAREARERRRRLLADVAALVPGMRAGAPGLDPEGRFPAAEMARLRETGVLAAPVPTALGGLGLGTEPGAAQATMRLLRLLGQGNLSVGRLIEAHVNALRLVVRYGDAGQARAAAQDALAGNLFGLWVTDAPDAKLRLGADQILSGAKAPCSGAGRATRAVVTVAIEAELRAESGSGPETRLAVLRMPDGGGPSARADLSGWDAQGMRASASGRMRLDGMRLQAAELIGGDGDYLRQPDFSAGAWRTSAVTLGGLDTLVEALCDGLRRRGRADDPHQQARIGAALIARETAALWVWRAAAIGEAEDGDAGDVAGYVNLARLAVEAAALEIVQLVQRGLGLEAFRRGALVELFLRDLAVYLRQPAPDVTLTEAAAHFTARALPPLPDAA